MKFAYLYHFINVSLIKKTKQKKTKLSESCIGFNFLIDMQVLEDMVLLKTHMHSTKTEPYSSCKELKRRCGLTWP